MAVSFTSVAQAGTPKNSNKDGNFIRLLLRDTTSTSPGASPRTASFVISNARLQTAAPRGALRRIFRAFDDGLSAAAGITKLTALTQAQAREIMDSRCASPSTPSVLTTSRVPRARISIEPIFGSVGAASVGVRQWTHDVSVDTSGRPTILVAAHPVRTSVASAGNTVCAPAYAFLNIEYCHPITGR